MTGPSARDPLPGEPEHRDRWPDAARPDSARVTSDRLARSGVPCSNCGMPYDRCTVLVLDQGRPCCSSCGRVNTHDEREVTATAGAVTERLEAQAADAVAELTDALDLDAGARDVLAVVTCCLHGERGYCAALVAPSVPPRTTMPRAPVEALLAALPEPPWSTKFALAVTEVRRHLDTTTHQPEEGQR